MAYPAVEARLAVLLGIVVRLVDQVEDAADDPARGERDGGRGMRRGRQAPTSRRPRRPAPYTARRGLKHEWPESMPAQTFVATEDGGRRLIVRVELATPSQLYQVMTGVNRMPLLIDQRL
jgi:hypothetical protein